MDNPIRWGRVQTEMIKSCIFVVRQRVGTFKIYFQSSISDQQQRTEIKIIT